ncbi:Hypothetical predicted protein [Mytilus galloprovincialis]|uniref:B box-type domain-containing protein n=1 Tax=Mytilus galloprovincialis TaxID=29158 RepID=A0A8B6E973_MYTGA|nr:Hypothetical predicted protein [Mytilus galloprovincialis]
MTSRCASCLRGGDVEKPTHWCSDCSEPLCGDCYRYHMKSKVSTKHKIITIANVSDLSPAVLNLSYKCKIHPDQSLAFFCPSHDMMCCVSCIPQNHKQCDQLITLDNEAENVKRSKFLQALEMRIQDTKLKLTEFVKKKNENVSVLNDQKDKIQKEIGYIRKSISDHFDKIENQLYNALTRAHDLCHRTLKEGIEQIQERLNKMDVWHKDIATLKENASDVHIFTVVKTIQPLQNKQEAYLNTLQDEYSKLNIEFIGEEAWRHLIADVPSFGEISVTESNPAKGKDYLHFKRNNIATTLSEQLIKIPENRKFNFATAKLDKGTKIRSGCFLADNRLLLASFNDTCVYVCNKDGDKRKKIPLHFKLSDLSFFDKQHVIVGTGSSIRTFKTSTLSLGECISDTLRNDVISSANNHIAIRSPSGTISVLDATGKLLRELKVPSYGYITIDRFGRVYYTNNAKNEVHCFYPNGSHSCIYRHERLKDPSGMTTDDAGNVYVAGHLSHNIHKISGQGKKHEIILSYKDGIIHPQRIAFQDKSKELLIINNEWRSVEIYQL